MSQQKILFTVCLAAVIIGTAYSQNMINPMECGQKMQQLANTYLDDNMKMLNGYAGKFADAGASAVDVQGVTQQIQAITTSYSDFTDTSKGFSLDRFTQLGTNVLTQQAKLGTMMMNPRTGMQGMQLYMGLISDGTSMYTKFLTQAMSACLSN